MVAALNTVKLLSSKFFGGQSFFWTFGGNANVGRALSLVGTDVGIALEVTVEVSERSLQLCLWKSGLENMTLAVFGNRC